MDPKKELSQQERLDRVKQLLQQTCQDIEETQSNLEQMLSQIETFAGKYGLPALDAEAEQEEQLPAVESQAEEMSTSEA